jgi:hypothetical protein
LDDVTPLREAVQRDAPLPSVHLFAPRDAHRLRYTPSRRPGGPEYPPAGATVDYWLQDGATSARLEIVDSSGRILRVLTSDGGAGDAAAGDRARAPRRGPAAIRLPLHRGANRIVWDLRHSGTWSASQPQGSGDGPLVAPGEYELRLSVTRDQSTMTASAPLTVVADPRVIAAGVTQSDLEAQEKLLLQLRGAISDARRLVDALQAVRSSADPAKAAAIDAALSKLVTGPGPYPQPMLIDQLSNVVRMLGAADQRPGRDAWDRYEDLRRELTGLEQVQ